MRSRIYHVYAVKYYVADMHFTEVNHLKIDVKYRNAYIWVVQKKRKRGDICIHIHALG
jgi:hypothetical protein